MDLYVISETPTSTGGAGNALCGTVLGWDTQIPLSAYNTKDHIRSTWCQKCWEIYNEETK